MIEKFCAEFLFDWVEAVLYTLTIYKNDMEIFKGIAGFQWDVGNLSKNWEKHQVSSAECEEIFFNKPLIVADDEKHSAIEKRFFALGKTDAVRRLFVAFTLRTETIRVISARSMNNKEQAIYETREKGNS